MANAFDLEGASFLPPTDEPTVDAKLQNTASGKDPSGDGPTDRKFRKGWASTASGQIQKYPDYDDTNENTASGQKRQVDEDDEDDNKSTKSSTTSGVSLPVGHAFGKVAKCFCCNKNADSASPLVGASADDAYGGCLPWNNYNKYPQGATGCPDPFKKPTGDLCTPCVQSYGASGMSVQHGKISDYKKNVVMKATEASTHQVFLEMRAHWIKKFNDDHRDSSTASGKKRLSLKSQADLKERFVEVRKSTSTAVQGREKYFVEEQHWDEKKDGKYDKAKATTEVIFGKKRTGMWVFTGREGVWEGITEEKQSIEDVHVEEFGTGGLVEHAADVKAKALQESLFL